MDGDASGDYDFVLTATGFIGHPAERRFRRASPERCLVVHVDEGRPVDTLRALSRDFGLRATGAESAAP